VEEKVVVPLDGSKLGEVALAYVEGLFDKMAPEVKKEVVLLQVLSAFAPVVVCGEACIRVLYSEDQMTDFKARSVRYLKRAGKTLKDKGVVVTIKVKVGFPPEEIIQTAEEVNASMISLSSHGLSGFSGWAFGGVADKVIRRGGRIPITLVRVPDYRKLPLARPVDEK
jgi:nucleotide-binding universal stress UspA family protein